MELLLYPCFLAGKREVIFVPLRNECAEQYFKELESFNDPEALLKAQKHYSHHISEKLTKHALAICEMTGESTEAALKNMLCKNQP